MVASFKFGIKLVNMLHLNVSRDHRRNRKRKRKEKTITYYFQQVSTPQGKPKRRCRIIKTKWSQIFFAINEKNLFECESDRLDVRIFFFFLFAFFCIILRSGHITLSVSIVIYRFRLLSLSLERLYRSFLNPHARKIFHMRDLKFVHYLY